MNPYEKYEQDRLDTLSDAYEWDAYFLDLLDTSSDDLENEVENEVADQPVSQDGSIPISFTSILLENHALEPNPGLVFECLNYSLETGEPLPPFLIGELVYHMDLLRKGWESPLFKKQGTKRSKHPLAESIERSAVSYINSGLKNGLDETPVKTISEALNVSSSTVYRWRAKYEDATDSLNKLQMSIILDHFAPHYASVRSE